MAHDNNINIGSIGTGNTVHIDQRQAQEAPRVEYSVDERSLEHVSRSEVDRSTLAFWGTLSLPVLAIVADGLGVLSFLGIQTKWALAVLVPIALLGAAFTHGHRMLARETFKPNEAKFLDGKWVERTDDGDYVLYRNTAPCIYPKCAGTVFIRPAPPREQPNHTLVGVCNAGGHRHTYTVDYNHIGYPAQFDWRPIEERKS